MKKAIFLDRDGVIIDGKKEFIYKKEDVSILPGVIEALKTLKSKGYILIGITNQPAIARGLTTEKEVEEIHNFINEETGNLIDRFYFCPHHPEMHPDVPSHAIRYRIPCNCRKPSTGMLLRAAEDFNIDLSQSWMVGDMISDIACGKNAGCKTAMVRSNLNDRIIITQNPFNTEIKPDVSTETLLDATKFL